MPDKLERILFLTTGIALCDTIAEVPPQADFMDAKRAGLGNVPFWYEGDGKVDVPHFFWHFAHNLAQYHVNVHLAADYLQGMGNAPVDFESLAQDLTVKTKNPEGEIYALNLLTLRRLLTYEQFTGVAYLRGTFAAFQEGGLERLRVIYPVVDDDPKLELEARVANFKCQQVKRKMDFLYDHRELLAKGELSSEESDTLLSGYFNWQVWEKLMPPLSKVWIF